MVAKKLKAFRISEPSRQLLKEIKEKTGTPECITVEEGIALAYAVKVTARE